jgi:CRISPR-associated protein Csb1
MVDGQPVQCVVLDSVQSQANRMELALLEAWRSKKIEIPVITVRFDDSSLKKKFVVTSLDAPHRAADAILRDSLLGGVMFRKSEQGRVLDHVDVRNATGLFGLNPTALVFGIWDSTGPRGGLGAKFQRAMVSEMVGFNANPGVATGGKVDMMNILIDAGTLFERKNQNDSLPNWTLEKSESTKILGKHGKPSEANLGGVTPDIAYVRDKNRNIIKENDGSPRIKGGFTISHAMQTTVLSLAALRRLRFPLNGVPDSNIAVDQIARVALAALGLTAATLAREEGADLRSRCQLFPSQNFVWELLDVPGESPKQFELSGDDAMALMRQAVTDLREVNLPWHEGILLTPSSELTRLVANSQDLALAQASEGGE